jgi:hypothetical protein
MATEHSYHRFDPVDMLEIRQIRSEYLRGFRLKSKRERVDKIAKAILPDVDWNKIGVKPDDAKEYSLTEDITELETEISVFRDFIKSKLEDILCCVSDGIINDEVYWEGPKEHFYEAAKDMAHKYHERSTKSGRRRHRNSKPSKKAENDTQTVPTPSPPPKSPPKAKQVVPPSPSTPAAETHGAAHYRPTTRSTKAKTSTSNQSRSAGHATREVVHGSAKVLGKSNIKGYFKNTKSSKSTKSNKPTGHLSMLTNFYSAV